MSTVKPMKIGSLCSGYGGIDIAVEEFFGATTAWHCEWEAAPSKILAHHWNVPNHHDLTTTDWDAVEPVDILTGGYPCQPFSAAGQRKGADDERHLWPHVREAIRRLRPRLTLLENVAGHRSLGFDQVLGDCAEDGLSVRWVSLRASDVGAPHGRERLFFIVANPGGLQPERRGGHGDMAGSSSSREGAHGQRERDGDAPVDRGAVASNAADREQQEHASNDCSATLAPRRIVFAGADGGCHDLGRHLAVTHAPHGSVAAGDAGSASPVDWGVYGPAIRRWEHVTGRPAPAPTEPGRNGPQLSPLLVEWMMGLPAGWVTNPDLWLNMSVTAARKAQLKALGNGVVPQQAAEALRRLVPMEAAA